MQLSSRWLVYGSPKTKAVLKSLKKSNFLTKARTENADKKLSEVRNVLNKSSSETTAKDIAKQTGTNTSKPTTVTTSELNQTTEGVSKL
ncbi:hypothetical protein ScPMuIL_001555 [Solemya velum]